MVQGTLLRKPHHHKARHRKSLLPEADRHCGKEAAMHAVVGPIVTRAGGYAFDSWTSEEGLSRGYSYRRIEDAHYARNIEIRSRSKGFNGPMVACSTVQEFASTLADHALAAARHRLYRHEPSA